MHILILPSWYPKNSKDVSGVFFRDQALALQRYGHRVGVIAPLMRSMRKLLDTDESKSLLRYEDDGGVNTYRKDVLAILPRVPYGNYKIYKNAARTLLKRYIKDQGKPDIIHAHSAIFAGAAAEELSKEFSIPFVLTEHSTGFARKIYSSWQLKLAKKAIQESKSCIAVSPSLADLISKQFQENKTKWLWVPNVVADRFEGPKTNEREGRPLRFLNLALMTEKKGQLDLIRAFVELINKGTRAELWFGGDGPIRVQLEDMVKSSGISESVHFLGIVPPDEVPGLLTQVDVMVVSSHYETFGVVAAEALMAGIPVIATRCGGPECIVESGDGLLVEPRNPESLATAMLKIAQTIGHYDPKIISERARKRFSGPAIANQLTRIYEDIMRLPTFKMENK